MNEPTLCACGCGEQAPIAKKTKRSIGLVKGSPCRFVMGHNANAHPPLRDLLSRIAPSGPDGCIEWPFSRRRGYGRVMRGGRSLGVHRVAYEDFVGPIPAGMDVLHSCDNPACFNPQHLFLGTDLDNWRDCVEKGRSRPARGEEHGHSKLTEADVLRIVNLHRQGLSESEIAAEFNISDSNVGAVARGESWGWLTGIEKPA